MGAHPCSGGCGRTVSENKQRCYACIEEAAYATIAAKNEEPMDETTHILMRYESQNREDLYRASDGMLVASRQGEVVRFGAEPKEAGNRLFLNAEYAAKWLRKLASMEMIASNGKLKLSDVAERPEQPVDLAAARLADRMERKIHVARAVIEERNAEHLIAMPSGSPVQVLRN